MFFKILTISFLILISNPLWAVCTNRNKVHLRKGPGRNSPISWTVGRFYPLIKIKTQGNWILVADQDGEKHWVYRGYVSNKVKCLSIKFARAELRKKPSFRSEFADYRYAEKYESFERIKTQGKWYFVRNLEGGEGWLHRDQVWRAVKKISLKY